MQEKKQVLERGINNAFSLEYADFWIAVRHTQQSEFREIRAKDRDLSYL